MQHLGFHCNKDSSCGLLCDAM